MRTPTPSLVDLLEQSAARDPDAVQYRYLHRGEVDEGVETLTRAQLVARARALGARIAAETAPGDRVLLLYPPGLETFVAFFACLYADVIAVPMTPPDPQRLGQTLPRLLGIIAQSGATLALSTPAVVDAASALREVVPELAALRFLADDETSRDGRTVEAPRRRARRDHNSVAFLQYTSGSLGAPKGVMVTDAGLLANLEMIRVGMVMGPTTPGVFWLPHHHDMGFIGGGLEFVYCGAPCTMLSPVAFIQRPGRWLRAITRYGGVVAGGPCFAYEHCVRRVADEELDGLDLSSWNVAFVGAEPERAAVLDRFVRRIARCNFRREALYPCFGLAESTLFVSGKPMDPVPLAPREITVSAAALEQNRVVYAEPGETLTRTLMSSGAPRLDADVVIVDAMTHVRKAPGEVGEIWTRGPNLAAGYWNDPEKTRAAFGQKLRDTGEGAFFATGDLGFIDGGELFVTGRSKEVMILGGRNHYPQDLEETIEASHPDLRHGGSAAFSYELADDEVLAVVAEVRAERIAREQSSPEPTGMRDILAAVRAALLKHHTVVAKDVTLITPQSLPKTTSGKKARVEMRRRFLAGEVEGA